jgi:hypothetical protein
VHTFKTKKKMGDYEGYTADKMCYDCSPDGKRKAEHQRILAAVEKLDGEIKRAKTRKEYWTAVGKKAVIQHGAEFELCIAALCIMTLICIGLLLYQDGTWHRLVRECLLLPPHTYDFNCSWTYVFSGETG